MLARLARGCFAMTLMLLTQGAVASVLFQNTFDAGTEGWTAFTTENSGARTALTVDEVVGRLQHQAPSDGLVSLFQSSSEFGFALRSAVGGSVSWDLSTEYDNKTDVFFSSGSDIEVWSAGGDRINLSVLTGGAPVEPKSQTFQVEFSTGYAWHYFDGNATVLATQEQIDGVLANAANLILRAEYWTSGGLLPDTTFLDNVILRGRPELMTLAVQLEPQTSAVALQAIPEPGTLALLGLGFAGLAATRRRKQ